MRALAAVAALGVALISGTPDRDSESAAYRFGGKYELPSKTTLMQNPGSVREVYDSEEEQLGVPVCEGVEVGIFELKFKRVGRGKSACDAVADSNICPIESCAFGHFLRQEIANLQPISHVLHYKISSPDIAKSPENSSGDGAVCGASQFIDRQVDKVSARFLRLGGGVRHFALRICGSNVGVGTGFNSSRLCGDRLGLSLCIGSHGFARGGLPLHLIDLGGKSIRFPPDLRELVVSFIRLPFGLNSQPIQIGNRGLDVAGISRDTISGKGDDQRPHGDESVYRIKNFDFTPSRFGRLLSLWTGSVLFGLGWVWLLAAGRLGLTLGDVSWRGLLASVSVLIGVFLLWQAAPLALP